MQRAQSNQWEIFEPWGCVRRPSFDKLRTGPSCDAQAAKMRRRAVRNLALAGACRRCGARRAAASAGCRRWAGISTGARRAPRSRGRQVIVRRGGERARGGCAGAALFGALARARVRRRRVSGGRRRRSSSSTIRTSRSIALDAGRQRRSRITDAQALRFADLAFDAVRGRLIAVAGDSSEGERRACEPDELARCQSALADGAGKVEAIAPGRDFYASPRLSPDGGTLAFLAWDLPDMPWDSAALYSRAGATTAARAAEAHRRRRGQLGVPAASGAPDGDALFHLGQNRLGQSLPLGGRQAPSACSARAARNCGGAQWVFGMRCYRPASGRTVRGELHGEGGCRAEVGRLARGGKASGLRNVRGDAARIDDPVALRRRLSSRSSSPPLAAPAIVRIGRERTAAGDEAGATDPGDRCVSRGEVIAVQERKTPARVGDPLSAGQPALLAVPAGTAPPALILAHGGPTSMSDASFKPRVQFYT